MRPSPSPFYDAPAKVAPGAFSNQIRAAAGFGIIIKGHGRIHPAGLRRRAVRERLPNRSGGQGMKKPLLEILLKNKSGGLPRKRVASAHAANGHGHAVIAIVKNSVDKLRAHF